MKDAEFAEYIEKQIKKFLAILIFNGVGRLLKFIIPFILQTVEAFCLHIRNRQNNG